MSRDYTKFFPSKQMGQNFLIDREIVQSICDILPNFALYDAILEIGPGKGVITRPLVSLNIPLFCIELDKRLFADLKIKYQACKNLTLINDDVLMVDFVKLFQPYKKIIIVANIPYNITSPIILKCLNEVKIDAMYLMVQKEVARKLNYHKTTTRNAFVNIVNYYYDVKIFFDISPKSFSPQPEVYSSFIGLKRKRFEPFNWQFFKFMKPFFLSKRKKLLNNIHPFIAKEALVKWLEQNNIDLNIRAENLDYDIFMKMFHDLGPK